MRIIVALFIAALTMAAMPSGTPGNAPSCTVSAEAVPPDSHYDVTLSGGRDGQYWFRVWTADESIDRWYQITVFQGVGTLTLGTHGMESGTHLFQALYRKRDANGRSLSTCGINVV